MQITVLAFPAMLLSHFMNYLTFTPFAVQDGKTTLMVIVEKLSLRDEDTDDDDDDDDDDDRAGLKILELLLASGAATTVNDKHKVTHVDMAHADSRVQEYLICLVFCCVTLLSATRVISL
jgi:hypothetical protein